MERRREERDFRKKAFNFWLHVALQELLKDNGRDSLIELALETAIKIALDEPTPQENRSQEVSHA